MLMRDVGREIEREKNGNGEVEGEPMLALGKKRGPLAERPRPLSKGRRARNSSPFSIIARREEKIPAFQFKSRPSGSRLTTYNDDGWTLRSQRRPCRRSNNLSALLRESFVTLALCLHLRTFGLGLLASARSRELAGGAPIYV